MRPSRLSAVLTGETLFVAVMSLSGPFSLFLAPLFAVFWLFAAPGRERARLLLLGLVCPLGAAAQIKVIVAGHRGSVVPLVVPYDWRLWLNLPFLRIATDFGSISSLFVGKVGFVLSLVCIAGALLIAAMRHHRLQKFAILYFSAAVAFGGMNKFRDALGSQSDATRYFYAGSILVLWFLALALHGRRARYVAYVIIVGTEVSLVPPVANTPLSWETFHWPSWAAGIDSSLPVIAPINPKVSTLTCHRTPADP